MDVVRTYLVRCTMYYGVVGVTSSATRHDHTFFFTLAWTRQTTDTCEKL